MSADSGWGYVHPDDRERCAKHWLEALEKGVPYQCEVRLLRSDGIYRWHLRRALPERGSDRQIDIGVVADRERVAGWGRLQPSVAFPMVELPLHR